MNWIDYVCELTKSAETPKKFRVWSCIAALSAVAKRKLSLKKGDGETVLYSLFPNLSILIVAQSGDQRKSFAVTLTEKIIKHVPSVLNISGHNSIQSIVKDISSVRTGKDGKNTEKSDGSVFLSSDEWTNLIQEDPSAMTQLNSLLDSHYHDDWKERMKNAGTFELANPYCTMFGATTPEHLEERVQKKDLLGGFFARTLVVSSVEPIILNSLTKTTGKNLPYPEMAIHLNKIATLSGEYQWTDAGERLFDEWYRTYMSSGREKLAEMDKTNLIYKAQDHVIRVGMCLDLAEDKPTLTLTEDNIQLAIEMVQGCLQDARRALFSVAVKKTADELQDAMKEIMMYLIGQFKNGVTQVKRSKLLQYFYTRGYSSMFIDRVEYALKEAGMIDVDNNVKDRVYKIKEGSVSLYEEADARLKGRKRVG